MQAGNEKQLIILLVWPKLGYVCGWVGGDFKQCTIIKSTRPSRFTLYNTEKQGKAWEQDYQMATRLFE